MRGDSRSTAAAVPLLMAVLTAPDEPEVIASPRLTAPVLRVRRNGESRERTVVLSTGKYTVGSSPQCQVHLPTADVRPLQCLILLEPNAATVTRWASGVQLNGRDFSKAPLEDGDRLTLGGWEIEFDRNGDSRPRVSSSDVSRPTPAAPPAIEPPPKLDAKSPARTASPAAAPIATRPTELVEAAPSVGEPRAEQPRKTSAYAFQDRLVLDLWTANYQARRRAKGLINGIRAARFQADAMAADLSAMETELDLARAAYDSHIGNDDRLQQELAALRHQEELSVALLTEEIASLRVQFEFAQATLAQRTAECQKLEAEVASLPQLTASAEGRAAELEAALASQAQQVETLTRQLWSLQEEQRQLVEQHRAECERAAQLEQELSAKTTWAAPPDAAFPVKAVEPSAEPWPAVEPLSDTEAEVAQPPASWDVFAPVTSQEPASSTAAQTDAITRSSAVQEESAIQTRESLFESSQVETDPSTAAMAMAAAHEPPEEQPGPPAWAATTPEQPVSEFSSTSFIDKYRHLLEEDDSTSAALPGARQPMIEEEFLSPAKAQLCASPPDESDDALEAYMANMMRRVRSSSTSFDAHRAPTLVHEPAISSRSHFHQSTSQDLEAASSPSVADLLSSEPISFEDLKLATRKVPLASDLATLREIANSTARTAIKTHVQRRTRESAITKLTVALTAMVSAAYLMASAPALDNWQFWTGAATCVVGFTAAIQVLILERRRQQ